ncbi:hypothetical protein ESB00_12030 [Oleiharenicola lentus]|uniref:Uncharacterized protein n=1 Tax=Oleiharenicola lentus TaxID=2508720 RepID=A0A4Q1CBZ7_9BACT|nr:hypothetical protein [Oleiharenicola lentus]RXK56558.1 hypothetical protein ESB00_12030 [Oleiharenicola lentus]
MSPRFLLVLLIFVSVARLGATTDWPDADGVRFQGEPAAIFGSLALFRTTDPVLKRVPLRALSIEECQRFHQVLASRPARATRWSEAQSAATRELNGALKRLEYQYRRMIPADLSDRPEPELLVVIYGYHGDSGTWMLSNNLVPIHNRLQNVYPGLTATVFYGMWHNEQEHERVTIQSWTPWLVTDFKRQAEMPTLTRRAPPDGSAMVVMTRDGDLLLWARPLNLAAIRKFIDDLSDLVWAASPLNSRAWTDRAHYGRAVRSLAYASTDTGPELIGNPLRADGLRQRGVGRVTAKLEIDAEGKVTAATLQPDAAVPAKLAGPLTDALKRAMFLPAMNGGQAVASTSDYVLEVPPATPQADADLAWLDRSIRGEVPLLAWKTLGPIPVNEQEFSEIESVGPDGRVVLRAFEVSDRRVSRASQESAFNSDFFGETGAANVVPVDGQAQIVDGKAYAWKAIQSQNGYVNLQEGIYPRPEYCVGYAWTEIEVSADTQAWLGIGSDDGLKVWHNGELVNDRWTRRISRIDDDIVPLRLKAGKNHLLIKIQNVAGDWSFVTRLRFRDR